MSDEELMMRKRLTVEGEGGGDDRRIMSLVKTFVRWSNVSNLSEDENEATFQKMLFALCQCEFSVSKIGLVIDMNRKEMERYETVYAEIESNIEDAKQQISDYKEELQRAMVIRRQRQEYNALAKVIQDHPPRNTSRDKITELELTLKRLIGKKVYLDRKLDLRRKQFHLLVQCVHQLQDELKTDNEPGDSAIAMDTT